jgi:putative heme-binding domain-containing protein
VYVDVGTCVKCHQFSGVGQNVGPDLTEIGDKLSREAFYESILYPSAGISHNYEAYAAVTKDGTVVTGLLVSKTPDEITLKGSDAIPRTFRMSEIEELAKQDVSLMPADLQKVLDEEQLVDLVEFLTTLKKGK